MLFDQNRVDAIIHNWKNQVFSNETIQGVPQRHSTCLKPPIGGFRNLASSGVAGISGKHRRELNRTSVLFKMSAFASGVVDLGKGIVIKVFFQTSIHNSDNLGKWPPFMTGRLKVTFVSKV